MKYKRKCRPFFSCDIASLEQWLCDMAAKGLFYESSGILTVKFSVAEPSPRRYRLEYADVVGSHIKEEKSEMYEEIGWHVANDLTSDLVVVYTDDPEAGELYSEPELTVKPLESIRKKSICAGILFIMLGLLTKIGLPLDGSGFIHTLLQYGTVYYILLWLAAILLITAGIMRLVSAKRLMRYMQTIRTEPDAGMVLAKKNVFKTAVIALSVPLIIFWAIHLLIDPYTTTYKTADVEREYPFATYADVFPEEYEALAFENGWDKAIHEKSDILAPSIIEMWETNQHAEEHFRVSRYEMRSDALAEKMYAEGLYGYTNVSSFDAVILYNAYASIAKECGWNDAALYLNETVPDYKLRDLALDGANGVYITDENSFAKILLIRKDNIFTTVIYVGSSEGLDERAEMFIK